MLERIRKWHKTINSDVQKQRFDAQKKSMSEQEAKHTIKLVEIEEQVKELVNGQPTTFQPYYIIFGKEIYKVLRKHFDETARDEICILCQKWYSRGLDPAYLNKITNLYADMGCFEGGLPWTGLSIVYVNGDDASYTKGYTLDRPIPGSRYTENGDGTFTDNATGLTWIKQPSLTNGTWSNKIAEAEAMTFAGHSDWRMPNVKEVLSIIDFSRNNPALPVNKFIGLTTHFVWTSTTYVLLNTYAIRVALNLGLASAQIKTSPLISLFVRGGKP